MSYYFSKNIQANFDQAVERVTEALKVEGFGVLTVIDMSATLKNKLGVEMNPYKILGACNPGFAHQAVTAEPHIGALLPCNVILRELDSGEIEVAAVDPFAQMMAVKNEQLEKVAGPVQEKLKRVIDSL